MSNTAIRNLGREKIQQILTSVGVESEEDTKHNIDAVEYNWHQPHCFSSNQLKKLDLFMEKTAQCCAVKFGQLYHSDFNATIVSTTQHFANELMDSARNLSDYYLAFGPNQDQISGIVGIPSQTAIYWTTQLLGDTNSEENSDRDLSQLEKSLLFDITSDIIEALSDSQDIYELQPADEIAGDQIPIEFEGTEELCKITFSIKNADLGNPYEAYFLIFCDELETIIGQKVETSEDISAQDISKVMLDYVQKALFFVTAQLGSTVLTFEEIMSLQVNDILLLDKMVDEPAELIVEGQTLFRGRPAKSSGKHAVVITELCNTK